MSRSLIKDRASFPILKVSGEGGWVDLEFGLLGYRIEGDSKFIMLCAGARHADREIAFNVLFPCSWTYDPPEGAPRGLFEYGAGMALVNARPLHGSFVQALASLYGLPLPAAGMANFTEVSAVTLKDNPERVLYEPVSLKIFFGSFEGAAVPYAEAFLNVDVPNNTVQINEKDPEYRAAIIEGLVKGTPDQRGPLLCGSHHLRRIRPCGLRGGPI